MTEAPLPPELRRLLEAERERPAVPSETVEAALARYKAALGGAGGKGGGSAPEGSGGPGPGRVARWPSRLAGPVAGLLLGGALGYGAADATRPPPARSLEDGLAHVAGLATLVAPSAEAPPAIPESAPVAAPKAPSPSAAPARPSTLKAERVLLERARSALLRGDAKAAREALDLHAQRFPDGQLSEERDLLRAQVGASAAGGEHE